MRAICRGSFMSAFVAIIIAVTEKTSPRDWTFQSLRTAMSLLSCALTNKSRGVDAADSSTTSDSGCGAVSIDRSRITPLCRVNRIRLLQLLTIRLQTACAWCWRSAVPGSPSQKVDIMPPHRGIATVDYANEVKPHDVCVRVCLYACTCIRTYLPRLIRVDLLRYKRQQ